MSIVGVISSPRGCAGACEGRQAVRLGRVLVSSPLRNPHQLPRAAAGRLQQPLLPPASRLPAAVLRLPAAPGTSLVEVPTALPRDNVQGGDVLRLMRELIVRTYGNIVTGKAVEQSAVSDA
ncbi:unnamed protein product [Danaus chrysippus]|uniref:(African queen) hypothetical protein n=1 Tax=Danaus chrysippus TaxID=151541 RepID=A0A8J2QP54_9NEOP|nr:unnamed protein product [Danaus chrysippus]